jgi:hypothetical protein
MKLPFNNKKATLYAIIAVIVIFLSYKAKATEVAVGGTYTSGFNGGMGIILSERVMKDKIDVGLSLISDQTFNGKTTGNNGNVFADFIAVRPESWWKVLPSEVTIGGAYWIKTDDRLIGSQLGYKLGLKWRINDGLSVGIAHWSNSGTVRPNRGQDLGYVAWRF